MSALLLLTSALQPSAEVLPALALLGHTVKILPAEGSALLQAPDSDLLLVDGRQDLAHARDLCRLIRTTGTDVPVLLIVTEGGLAVVNHDWGMDDVVLHTCDTGGASSGSPMLIDGPAGPEVIGINVGTYLQSKVLTQRGEVVHRYKSETVANTAVSAGAFRPTLEALARADILTTHTAIMELQRLLAAEGHYTGTSDGMYGPMLNTAVRAFERAEGRGETGLATVALLKRLSARDAERRGAPGKASPPPHEIETGSVGSHTPTRGNAKLPR